MMSQRLKHYATFALRGLIDFNEIHHAWGQIQTLLRVFWMILFAGWNRRHNGKMDDWFFNQLPSYLFFTFLSHNAM